MKKFHSILRYAKSSRGFTEIKQKALVASKFVCLDGDQYLEQFCTKGRISLHCQKVGKSLDMGEPTFHAEKTLLIAAANHTLKNCTKSTQ